MDGAGMLKGVCLLCSAKLDPVPQMCLSGFGSPTYTSSSPALVSFYSNTAGCDSGLLFHYHDQGNLKEKTLNLGVYHSVRFASMTSMAGNIAGRLGAGAVLELMSV